MERRKITHTKFEGGKKTVAKITVNSWSVGSALCIDTLSIRTNPLQNDDDVQSNIVRLLPTSPLAPHVAANSTIYYIKWWHDERCSRPIKRRSTEDLRTKPNFLALRCIFVSCCHSCGPRLAFATICPLRASPKCNRFISAWNVPVTCGCLARYLWWGGRR